MPVPLSSLQVRNYCTALVGTQSCLQRGRTSFLEKASLENSSGPSVFHASCRNPGLAAGCTVLIYPAGGSEAGGSFSPPPPPRPAPAPPSPPRVGGRRGARGAGSLCFGRDLVRRSAGAACSVCPFVSAAFSATVARASLVRASQARLVSSD